MTVEVPELLGSASLGAHGISAAADNIILMRYLEIEGRLDRAVAVLKARGVNLGPSCDGSPSGARVSRWEPASRVSGGS